MKYTSFKPSLRNLSQGERIAFIRQIRRMTQDEVSDKLGLTGESKRRTMTRYERGDRIPKENRLIEIADILNVNINLIKEYDFKNDLDIIYFILWLEEIYPRLEINFNIIYLLNKRNALLTKFMEDWSIMKEKRLKFEINYEEYIEWKLNYVIGDVEYENNNKN